MARAKQKKGSPGAKRTDRWRSNMADRGWRRIELQVHVGWEPMINAIREMLRMPPAEGLDIESLAGSLHDDSTVGSFPEVDSIKDGCEVPQENPAAAESFPEADVKESADQPPVTVDVRPETPSGKGFHDHPPGIVNASEKASPVTTSPAVNSFPEVQDKPFIITNSMIVSWVVGLITGLLFTL